MIRIEMNSIFQGSNRISKSQQNCKLYNRYTINAIFLYNKCASIIGEDLFTKWKASKSQSSQQISRKYIGSWFTIKLKHLNIFMIMCSKLSSHKAYQIQQFKKHLHVFTIFFCYFTLEYIFLAYFKCLKRCLIVIYDFL